VNKLAANAGDCAVGESATLLLLCAAKIKGWLVRNHFPLRILRVRVAKNIKLQKCAVMAINFLIVRATRALLRPSSLELGSVEIYV
jgi:hypothetical protein